MNRTTWLLSHSALAIILASSVCGCASPGNRMTFFVTNANPGKGGDLGGLAGADAYCEQLAASVGAGGKDWKAYLSTQATDKEPAVNARDRIGNGPWHNAKGALIAYNGAEVERCLQPQQAKLADGEGRSHQWAR
jgi:hypothetical protein